MICHKCSQKAADGCIICPYCLTPLKGGKNRSDVRRRRGIWIAAAIFAVVAVAVLLLLVGCVLLSR